VKGFYSEQFPENKKGLLQAVILYAGILHMGPVYRKLGNLISPSARQPEDFRIKNDTAEFLPIKQIMG
jgi:hypothetical protein